MPNHIGTWHALAGCPIILRQRLVATDSLDAAFQIDRNFTETHGGLAVLKIMQKRVSDAKPLIQKALRLNPESHAGRFAQGLPDDRKGDPDLVSEIVERIMDSAVGPHGKILKDIPKDAIQIQH